MSTLPYPIKEALRHETDNAAMARMWRRVASRRSASGRRGRLLRYVALTVALAAGGALAVQGWWQADETSSRRHAPAAQEEVGPLVAPADGPFVQTFSDGSRVMLGPGASASVPLAQSSFIIVVLESGAATFDLKESGPRHWSIDAGLATLDAESAGLHLRREPDHLVVYVERGVVWLREKTSSGTVRAANAGDVVTITPDPAVEMNCTPRQVGSSVCSCDMEHDLARSNKRNEPASSHSPPAPVHTPKAVPVMKADMLDREESEAADPAFAVRFYPGAGLETKPARVELLRDRVRLVGDVPRHRMPANLVD